MARTGKLPDAIQNAPDLQPGLELHFEAFIALSSCRTHGMSSLSSIPWTAINDYAVRFGIEGQQFERLVAYIGAMDDHFLKVMRKKAK